MSLYKPIFDDLAGKGIAPDRWLFVVPDQVAVGDVASALEKAGYATGAEVAITMQELCCRITDMQPAGRMRLMYLLYKCYKKLQPGVGDFKSFEALGEGILADFDEMDAQLVDPQTVYDQARHEKALEARFADYMTEEEAATVAEFWAGFSPERLSETKKRYLELFSLLPALYQTFREACADLGIANAGYVAQLAARQAVEFGGLEGKTLVFFGFNKLGRAQISLMQAFIKRGQAVVYWDAPPLVQRGLPADLEESIHHLRKAAQVDGLSLSVAEALRERPGFAAGIGIYKAGGKVALARYQAKQVAMLDADALGKSAIVIPNAADLKPVLLSLPKAIREHVRVQVRKSFLETIAFTFLDGLRRLLQSETLSGRGNTYYHHKPALQLLGHPVLASIGNAKALAYREKMVESNAVRIGGAGLAAAHPLFALLSNLEQEDGLLFWQTIISYLLQHVEAESGYAVELGFAKQTLQKLADELAEELKPGNALEVWRYLYDALSVAAYDLDYGDKHGLTICMLGNTAGRAFEHVFFFNANEGKLPARPGLAGLLPQSLRGAFRLSTNDDETRHTAYLFYRLLGHAKHIYLLEDISDDGEEAAETSRYTLQLAHALGPLPMHTFVLNTSVYPVLPIVVPKTGWVADKLNEFLAPEGRPLFPTYITTFLECEFKFYAQYLAKLKEADEVSEDVDGSMFGNLVHNTMSALYEQLSSIKESGLVEGADIVQMKSWAKPVLEQELRKHYALHDDQAFTDLGYANVAFSVAERLVDALLDLDAVAVPFEVLYNESTKSQAIAVPIAVEGQPKEVRLRGKFDRVDVKDDAVYVQDFKTGSSTSHSIKSIEGLFAQEPGGHNKEAAQILLYTWLIRAELGGNPALRYVPRMISTKDLLNRQAHGDVDFTFTIARQPLTDLSRYGMEFEGALKSVLERLFDRSRPFVQTEHQKHCQYCSFARLCNRA